MRYIQILSFTIIMIILSISVCLANEPSKFEIGASKELVDVSKLYVVDGEGDYAHCKALKGYPGENKFQVYFQGDTYAKYITHEDLRGINIDEIIEWEMDGGKVKNYRKDIYQLFANTNGLHSRNSLYNGKYSPDWHRKTFEHVYEEWIEGMGFAQDAQTLLKHYFEYKYPVAQSNRYDLRDVKIVN